MALDAEFVVYVRKKSTAACYHGTKNEKIRKTGKIKRGS